ncbi:hypothetical protein E8E13_006366 [Curvularia kusanoi]|uniref:F-box domain-containing protein n=1 Tax=Curvularia kusanoi TaxID=90978 RepID=A0A9P4TCI4_CURKU|nr:hypothetical protein E8E13_006366 [Curvularia kusanoi]
MVRTPSFINLPPELICRVFECADDFSAVAALAQTATLFYHIWRKSLTSIYRAVAPRALLALNDAERLLDVQEQAENMQSSQDGLKQMSIIRIKRLLRNARYASTVTEHWVWICEWDELHDTMEPSEIERFQHALYGLWVIGVMGTTPHLKHKATAFLDQCSPRELCRLDDFASYMLYYQKNHLGSFGADFLNDAWRAGWHLVRDRWMDLNQERHQFREANGIELKFLHFFDENQKYLEAIDDWCQ